MAGKPDDKKRQMKKALMDAIGIAVRQHIATRGGTEMFGAGAEVSYPTPNVLMLRCNGGGAPTYFEVIVKEKY